MTREHNGQSYTGGERNPNKERTLLLVNIIILCLITLSAIAAAAFFYLRMRRSDSDLQAMNDRLYGSETQEKDLYTAGELESQRENARITGETTGEERVRSEIRSALQDGTSTLSVLRSVYPDDIVIASDGRYYFYPRTDEIGSNSYRDGDWQLDADGLLTYRGSASDVQILQGIEVSDACKEIDWQAVAADHVDYVMIDVGGRDEDGSMEESSWWEEYLTGARNAGLTVGICYEMNVTDEEEAEEDASYLAEILEPYVDEIDGYVAIMVRMPGESDRGRELSRETRTAAITTICNTLRLSGLQPVIYESVTSMMQLTDPAGLDGIDRWIINEGTNLYFPYAFTMWQYAAACEVDGISGSVPRSAWIRTQ